MAGRPDLKRGTLIALLAAVIVNGGAFASDGKELREGQRLYKAGKYNAAAGYFVGVMAREPKNANAIYYAAVSFQKAGDLERANNFYRLLIEHFPNSQAAVYARKAVGSSSAPARPTPTGRKQTSALRPGDSIPDRASVPFRREPGGHLYVDCQVNGRTLPMVFDTGAEACTIGKGQLSSLGLKVPEGARHIQVSGVGGVEDTVVVPTTIRLGNISRTVNVLCMEETKYSLLGQTFFGDLHYQIDNASGRINFTKPGAQSEYMPVDSIDIPFRREGNNLVVMTKINGVNVPMFFDTGAQGTLFTAQALNATGGRGFELLGYGTSSGVGGSHQVEVYKVDTVELGPIRQSKMRVTVDSSLPVPYGLLGQDFFGRRHFTIDDKKNVIRFRR